MLINLIKKLRSAFGTNGPKGAACTAVHKQEAIHDARFHDLDHLSGSWVADEDFDAAVKVFDLIERPRLS